MQKGTPLSSPAITKSEILHRHHHDTHQSLWDRIGVAGSALCIVHCISTPLLLGYLSAAGLGFLAHELFHQVFAIALLAVAIFAFLPGYRLHRRKGIVLSAALGVFLLIAAGFSPIHDLPYTEHGLTLLGSILLVGAHLSNRRCQTSCHH